MKKILFDTIVDNVKLIPFLFFIFFGQKINKKNCENLVYNYKCELIVGGFSSFDMKVLSNRVFASKKIIAVYLLKQIKKISIMIFSGGVI